MSGAAPHIEPAMLAEAAEDLGGRSRSGWFIEGARQALSGPMFVVAVSLLSVGGLARDAGFSVEVAVASTILLWAGPAQVLFFGAVAAKTSWPVIALTISLSSVRFVPMVVSLLPMLRTKRTGLPTLLLAAGLLFMTPIYFVATLTRNAKKPIDHWALVLGLAVAPLTEAFAPRGLDLMVLGLTAGTGAWLIQRVLDARARA